MRRDVVALFCKSLSLVRSLLLCNILVLQHVVGILRFMVYICRLKIFGHNRQLSSVLLYIVKMANKQFGLPVRLFNRF